MINWLYSVKFSHLAPLHSELRLMHNPFQIGKTKAFLRAGQMAELDARRTEVLANAARIIQRRIHTYIDRKEFISLRKATIVTQSHWRGSVSFQFSHLRISILKRISLMV